MKKGLILCGLLTLGLAGYGCHKDNQDMGGNGSMDSMHGNAATQPTSSADPSDAVPQSDNSATTDSTTSDNADASKQSDSSTSSEANTDTSANNSADSSDNTTTDAKPDESAATTDNSAGTDSGTQASTEKE